MENLRWWARGFPRHNLIDDECCPDFSCCYPDLFEEDDAKREARVRRYEEENPI